MKRFFCTICQKMKRVRVMPLSVETPNAENPEERVGQCRRHLNPMPVERTMRLHKSLKSTPRKVSA